MAMVVQHNISAQLALGELNKNSSKLGKLLGKVSSGQKINSAQDDASSYVISEKMREMVRTLNQDHQNVQNGSSLMKIAEGGINSIVEELRNLKELAINAANDTNTDVDRLTIQKVFDQKKMNINDIATETNYNTIRLLDGSLGNSATTSYWIGGDGDGDDDYSGGTIRNVYEPTNFISEISGNYTINSDGVYRLTDSANITINAKNVKIIQADPGTELSDVYITGPRGGGANLWIENFNVSNSQNKNFIKFQGENNYFNFKGSNNYSSSVSSMPSAVINVGGGLTVAGGNDGTGILNLSGSMTSYPYYGAVIGSNQGENLSGSDITVNSGNFFISDYREGALIGAACRGTIGNVIVRGGHFEDNYYSTSLPLNAIIGGGDYSKVESITIENAYVKSDYKTNDPAVGIGGGATLNGDIYIGNSYIYHRGSRGSGIGTAGYGGLPATVKGNITVENCTLDIEVTGGGAGIGSGAYSHVGGVTVINTDLSNVRVTGGGQVVGKGLSGTCGQVSRDGNGGGGGGGSHRRKVVVYGIDAPLIIHHGPKANQATKFYINDMHTKSLGTGKLVSSDGLPTNDEDLARYHI